MEHEESICTLVDDIQLNKAEKAWQSTLKKRYGRGEEEVEENDPEQQKTQELFKRVQSILNKMTPQKFQQLMRQVRELTIDTEERLKGVIDLTFEKAISEPDFSVVYANMCRCLMALRATDVDGNSVNFRKLLLNRCQKEFEKNIFNNEMFEEKKELEAASNDEERQRVTEEQEEAEDKARRRSLGVIKFIIELFKLKMLTEAIMHDCIVKLLKNHDQSLECLCLLLSTIGKDLDFEKAKPQMDQHFNQIEKIIKERKTCSRIHFMLQDVLDLRRSNWVLRRGDKGPKIIDQNQKSIVKKTTWQGREDVEENDPEQQKTQELYKRFQSILSKLSPLKFQRLMRQVTELTINTEERLKGVIDLTFEKAISEPDFSVVYANMCRCLMGLKVPATDKPGHTVNFRKLLLNRCQNEFEKTIFNDDIFEKQKELEAASDDEERQQLTNELKEAKDKALMRSLGNIKFIGELFKVKMLTEIIMHDSIVNLLKKQEEESLECLCLLLSTIGKDLDFEKAKLRMDQYFNQMEKIIKETKTSPRIRFMLQDVLDLRRNNWVPRQGKLGPKFIDQIHKDAEMEEHWGQMKLPQALITKKKTGGSGGRMGGGGSGWRHELHSPGRGLPPQDEDWNAVPISKNRPIDTSRLSKITKPSALDFNNQLRAPRGKGTWGIWGKGTSGGTSTNLAGTASDSGSHPALNRFSVMQQSSSSASSLDSDRRVSQSFRDRHKWRDERQDDRDRNRLLVTKRGFSPETKERSREREQRSTNDPVCRVSSVTDDQDSRERACSKDNVQKERATPPPQAPTKSALTEEELERKSTAIIEDYLHINNMEEALQRVQELNSSQLLFVFVRNSLVSTLERSTIAREHMGLLLHQLIKTGILSKLQYFKGLQEILEVAEDMAIDIPHIWLYLAELITPMLHEGGIPMRELFREVAKPLIPLEKAGVMLVQILTLLCKAISHKKACAMWREAGLRWEDYLPEDVDAKFVAEKNVEFTFGEESEKSQKSEMSSLELMNHLDRLIQDQADNQRIFDWIEANLDEKQTSSNMFVRALMTCICQSAIICENPYKVNSDVIKQRAKLLLKFLKDEQRELQALYALQALMVQMEQPANLLRMFFDALYDEDLIKEEAFFKWESSKDPAEQTGKGVARKSVTAFFTWLREAEEESDNS